MAERLTCVCGKEYWPKQVWDHRNCKAPEKPPEPPRAAPSAKKQRWDREKYNAYQLAYMRARGSKSS